MGLYKFWHTSTLALLFLGILAYVNSGCSRSHETGTDQGGTASLSFDGTHYDVPGVELLIYVTARADRDQIIELPAGQKADFHFAIGPTLKAQDETANKPREWLLQNMRRVSISWDELQIQDPEALTNHRISESDTTRLYMSLVLPNYGLISDNPIKQDKWIQIDQISQGRALGHFGGTFADPKSLQSIEVTDGTFDVPLEKLYKYK